jgi:hypothetical protein
MIVITKVCIDNNDFDFQRLCGQQWFWFWKFVLPTMIVILKVCEVNNGFRFQKFVLPTMIVIIKVCIANNNGFDFKSLCCQQW